MRVSFEFVRGPDVDGHATGTLIATHKALFKKPFKTYAGVRAYRFTAHNAGTLGTWKYFSEKGEEGDIRSSEQILAIKEVMEPSPVFWRREPPIPVAKVVSK